jgi:hypothetical protein
MYRRRRRRQTLRSCVAAKARGRGPLHSNGRKALRCLRSAFTNVPMQRRSDGTSLWAWSTKLYGARPRAFGWIRSDAVHRTPEFNAICSEIDQHDVGVGWSAWIRFIEGRAPNGLLHLDALDVRVRVGEAKYLRNRCRLVIVGAQCLITESVGNMTDAAATSSLPAPSPTAQSDASAGVRFQARRCWRHA